MALGNYINLSSPEYPSVSGAFKEFESGLIGIARMQEAANESRKQDMLESETLAERKRKSELDAQATLLGAAKDRRDQDNAAMANLMTLMKYQAESEERDERMSALVEQRENDREDRNILRIQRGVDTQANGLLGVVSGPNVGERTIALHEISTKYLPGMTPQKQEFVQKIAEGMDNVEVTVLDTTYSAMDLPGLRNGSREDQLRGALALSKMGASQTTITRWFPNVSLGDLTIMQTRSNLVGYKGSGGVAADIKVYTEFADKEKIAMDYINSLKENDPERKKFEADLIRAQMEQKAIRGRLEKAGALTPEGAIITLEGITTGLEKVSAREAEVLESGLLDPSHPVHEAGRAAEAEILKKANSSEQVENAIALARLKLPPNPERIAEIMAEVRTLTASAKDLPLGSDGAVKAAARITELDVELNKALLPAGLPAASGAEGVLGKEAVSAAVAVTELNEYYDRAFLGEPVPGKGNVPYESWVEATGARAAIRDTYTRALDIVAIITGELNTGRIIAGSGIPEPYLVTEGEFINQLNGLQDPHNREALGITGPLTPKQTALISSEMARLGIALQESDGRYGRVGEVPERLVMPVRDPNPDATEKDKANIARVEAAAKENERLKVFERTPKALTDAAELAFPKILVGRTSWLGDKSGEVSGDVFVEGTAKNAVMGRALGSPNSFYGPGPTRIVSTSAHNGAEDGAGEYVKLFNSAPFGSATSPSLAYEIAGLTGRDPFIGQDPPSYSVPGLTTASEVVYVPFEAAQLRKAANAPNAAITKKALLNAALIDYQRRITFNSTDAESNAMEFYKYAGVDQVLMLSPFQSSEWVAGTAKAMGVDEDKAKAAWEGYMSFYSPNREVINDIKTPEQMASEEYMRTHPLVVGGVMANTNTTSVATP